MSHQEEPSTKSIIPCFARCCSLGSQLFSAKTHKNRQQKNLLWPTHRGGELRASDPITTLAESTLCSKIETHRRQIKTRKKKEQKSNE